MSKCKTRKREVQKVYCKDCTHWGGEWLKYAKIWYQKHVCNHPLNRADSYYAPNTEHISYAQERNKHNICPDFQFRDKKSKKWWKKRFTDQGWK